MERLRDGREETHFPVEDVAVAAAAAAASPSGRHAVFIPSGRKRKAAEDWGSDGVLWDMLGQRTGLLRQPDMLEDLLAFLDLQGIQTRADWEVTAASPHALRVLLAAAEAAGRRGQLVARVVAAVFSLGEGHPDAGQ